MKFKGDRRLEFTEKEFDKMIDRLDEVTDSLSDAEAVISNIRHVLKERAVLLITPDAEKGDEITFEQRVRAFDLTTRDWQLFSTMPGVDEVANNLNQMLRFTVANSQNAIVAREIMYNLMNQHVKFGARDTEPECTLINALRILYNDNDLER